MNLATAPRRGGVILNAGPGAWAFEEHAARLSRVLRVPVSEEPNGLCYLLAWDRPEPPAAELYIPYRAIVTASDKRLVAAAFTAGGVPAPVTHLLATWEEVLAVLTSGTRQWVLKWPTGCGAGGHRLLERGTRIPDDWPRPYVLQEFVRCERPEVYRLYGAGGRLFGWNARRFPVGVLPSPWVAHARGARYEDAGKPPVEAERVALLALESTGLRDSFGCVDLLHAPDGRWLALEVGTDGVFNYVDRDVGLPDLSEQLDRLLAESYGSRLGETV